MKFNINTNVFKEALESIQVKGKYVSKGGLSAGKLEEVFYMKANDENVEFWTGNNTFIVNINVDAEVEEKGGYIGKMNDILPYLKKFGETVTVHSGEFLTLSSGGKKASVPRVIEWANIVSITRMGEKLTAIPFELDPKNLPNIGKATMEAAFAITNETLTDVISSCEIVGSGVYKIEVTDESVKFSSRDTQTNSFEQTIETLLKVGEPATVEFSGPLHKFFKKDQTLIVYSLDDAPVIIIADDRRLVKAPYIAGV